MQETQVQSLGWEDSLEKDLAAHSSIFAWEIPWSEESGGLQSMGSQPLRHKWTAKHTHKHDQLSGSKLGKDNIKAVYCHPAYLIYMQSTLCEKLAESHAGIKIAGRNINNVWYADDTTLMTESKEELKSLLMKVKGESEKAGLKLNIQKMKTMAYGPITSWQIEGETMETVTEFIFLGSKTTADGDCSHEIKRYLLLGRKAMTNLDSI